MSEILNAHTETSRKSSLRSKKAIFQILALHVGFPLLCGALIYTCWRKPTLLIFHSYRSMGLDAVISCVRILAHPLHDLMPRWILFSLPDGLWVYGWTAFMVAVWHKAQHSLVRTLWICGGLVLGAGGELGQLIGVVPGTFDLIDLLSYFVAFVLALTLANRMLNTAELK